MSRPLLVGELNPYGADPAMALYPLPEHASGGKLARILGLSRGEYLRRFDRCNLCTGRWGTRPAYQQADALMSTTEPGGRDFILLGARVSRAFGFLFQPFTVRERPALDLGEGRLAPRLRFFVLPHPSGRNLVWNRADAMGRARELLQEFLLPREGEEQAAEEDA